jgi:hypothetical protein
LKYGHPHGHCDQFINLHFLFSFFLFAEDMQKGSKMGVGVGVDMT